VTVTEVVTLGLLSVALYVRPTSTSLWFGGQSDDTSTEAVIAGGSVSVTVTVTVAVSAFALSEIVYVNESVPTKPGAGV
jgi:hypothetical protein